MEWNKDNLRTILREELEKPDNRGENRSLKLILFFLDFDENLAEAIDSLFFKNYQNWCYDQRANLTTKKKVFPFASTNFTLMKLGAPLGRFFGVSSGQ